MTRDARLLVLGLISMADDDGRFLASVAAIQGYVFPNDDLAPKSVRKWLDEAVTCGIVHEYTVSGVRYGCFPSWHKHQVINRYMPSKLPEPDTTCWMRGAR